MTDPRLEHMALLVFSMMMVRYACADREYTRLMRKVAA